MIKTLTLGYAGEYGARMMTIDLSEEAAMWPDAAAQLLLVRPGEHTPYPADNAVYADGCMAFTPTKADMAIAGQGYAQVYFYGADGNVLGKSSMMVTHILASLGGDSTEPPSGDELGYYDKLMQQAALAIAAGESAKEDAQSAAESAAKAEAALEEMKNISTQSGNMPSGGTTGQILAKKSDASFDAHWIDAPQGGSGSGNGTVTGVKIGDASYAPNASGVVDLSGMTAPNAASLNGKNASEYLLKSEAFTMELLWTNASVSSNFDAQTISLDLSQYQFVMLEYYSQICGNVAGDQIGALYGSMSEIIKVGEAASLGYVHSYGGDDSLLAVRQRCVRVRTDGIVFATAKFLYLDSTFKVEESSTSCKPYRIYGIKGVAL